MKHASTSRRRMRVAGAMVACLFVFLAGNAYSDCGKTLESLGLSGESLELAHELSRLHHEIKNQPKKALQEILESKFNAKVNRLHEAMAEQGVAVKKRELIDAIRRYEPQEPQEKKGDVEVEREVVLPEEPNIPRVKASELGSFLNRHQKDWQKGWESLNGGPLHFVELGTATIPNWPNSVTALPDGTFIVGGGVGSLYHLQESPQSKELTVLDEKVVGKSVGPTIVLPDGTLIVCSGYTNAKVLHYALAPEGKFKELGEKEIVGSVMGTPAALPDGSVLVPTTDGHLYHLKAEPSGKLTQLDGIEFPGRAPIFSSLTVLNDGTFLFGTSGKDSRFYRYQSNAEGKLKEVWKSDPFGEIISAPAVLSDGIVAVGSTEGDIAVFRIEDDGGMKEIDKVNIGRPIKTSVAGLSDGSFVFGADDGYLYHFRLEATGKLKELDKFETITSIHSSPVVLPGDRIVVGTNDPLVRLFKLDPNGRFIEMDKIPAGLGMEVSPTLLQKGKLVIAPQGATVYLLELKRADGKPGATP